MAVKPPIAGKSAQNSADLSQSYIYDRSRRFYRNPSIIFWSCLKHNGRNRSAVVGGMRSSGCSSGCICEGLGFGVLWVVLMY